MNKMQEKKKKERKGCQHCHLGFLGPSCIAPCVTWHRQLTVDERSWHTL